MRADAPTLQRAALLTLALGFALVAGTELWYAGQALGGVSAGQPQARADPPGALSFVLSLGAFFLPLGLVWAAALVLTRRWPAAERGRAPTAIGLFVAAIVLMLIPAIQPGIFSTASVGVGLAAMGLVILAWRATASRALLVTGGVLLALRYPALSLANGAYVRASGDGSWSAASWWSVAAFAIGAAASLCLALALAWRVKVAGRVLASKPGKTVA